MKSTPGQNGMALLGRSSEDLGCRARLNRRGLALPQHYAPRRERASPMPQANGVPTWTCRPPAGRTQEIAPSHLIPLALLTLAKQEGHGTNQHLSSCQPPRVSADCQPVREYESTLIAGMDEAGMPSRFTGHATAAVLTTCRGEDRVGRFPPGVRKGGTLAGPRGSEQCAKGSPAGAQPMLEARARLA